jgi:hypothetical protein
MNDRALAAIERRGILLVYPLANRPEPRSLWSELHPRTPMRGAWDAGADGRVARLWRLREELARSSDVVYAKWFRGRATFFSRSVVRGMLARMASEGSLRGGLSRNAATLMDLLEDDSPQSTKQLRANAEMQGRANEAAYTRALKELWSRLLIVGVGEVDDGAFPSLNMSATRLRFEDLWPGVPEADENRAPDAKILDAALSAAPLFARELGKTIAVLRASKRDLAPSPKE